MKTSIELMKLYSDQQQWMLPVSELVAKIGNQLGAVEETINLAPRYEGIVVVEITEAKPHPNADKLTIYQMNDGKNSVQVVSGDTSLQVGDKVGWIAPGQTVLITHGTDAPVVMEARALRGEMSNGMFGSGKELGLNDDHHKVAVLDTDAPAGTLLADAYKLHDTIIDIENKMFTHRPDGFGNLGVAREIAGIQGLPFASPDWYTEDAEVSAAQKPALSVEVSNEIPNLVPRYMAIVLDNIIVGPSPLWLQSYLYRLGIRPINNVVDITNYYMILTGQPMHAFDFDKISGGNDHAKIIVRKPKKDEQVMLLDGKTITPHADAMLITTPNHIIGLGGVMGGANSEIDAKTTRIVLECASFDMFTIRRTSMAHGLFTDAVTRYSKGQSPAQCQPVLAQAVAELVAGGAEVASKLVDFYPKPYKNEPIALTTQFINDRLGSSVLASDIAVSLNNVECTVEVRGDELIVTPPFWRTDITIAEDVVEEVGRLIGYENLPHELPTRPTQAVKKSRTDTLKNTIRELLAAAGVNELQTYSFVPAKLLRDVGQDPQHAFVIRNAISPELQHYRLSLTPSLLEKVHANIKAGYLHHALFELNKIHIKTDKDCDGLPREYQTLAFVYASRTAQPGAAYYHAKHYLTYVLDALHVPYTFVVAEHAPQWEIGRQVYAPFEPKRSGFLLVGEEGEFAGFIGEYHAKARKNLKLPEYAAGFEIDLERILKHQKAVNYQPLLKFPAIEQDVCLKVDAAVTYGQLETTVSTAFPADKRLRITISPLDIYQKHDDTAHKQITFHIALQHSDRTLTRDEAAAIIDKVVAQVSATIALEVV
jgi:phenylalanyl-tRNA synthetase beta chain